MCHVVLGLPLSRFPCVCNGSPIFPQYMSNPPSTSRLQDFVCRPGVSAEEDPYLGWSWARKCEGLYELCKIWIGCQGLVLLSSSARNHREV